MIVPSDIIHPRQNDYVNTVSARPLRKFLLVARSEPR